MKTTIIGLIFLSLFINHTVSFSQSTKDLDAGYYIVVSAYSPARESVAQQYIKKLQSDGYEAEYGMDAKRHLLLVYIQYFGDFKAAIQNMTQTRKAGVFTDAWVRVIPGDIPQKAPSEINEEKVPPPAPAEKMKAEDQEGQTKDKPAPVFIPNKDKEEKIPEGDSIKAFVNLFYVTRNRIVDGRVDVIDTERSKLLKTVNGNEFVYLSGPETSSQSLTLIVDVFGYRKMQHEVIYPLTRENTIDLPFMERIEGIPTVNFALDRYHKGDIVVMYNVYFYNDASIMLPVSKYELNSLLEMMQENPNYRIRLHGHTNGKWHGKIISMGPDKNFFAVTEESKRSNGSANKLSGMRAETIRQYLIEEGIDAGRVETKAWGGKQPLYEEHSLSAKKNVRVEVEILAE